MTDKLIKGNKDFGRIENSRLSIRTNGMPRGSENQIVVVFTSFMY